MNQQEDIVLRQMLADEGMISREWIDDTGLVLREEFGSASFHPLESESTENRIYTELFELSRRGGP